MSGQTPAREITRRSDTPNSAVPRRSQLGSSAFLDYWASKGATTGNRVNNMRQDIIDMVEAYEYQNRAYVWHVGTARSCAPPVPINARHGWCALRCGLPVRRPEPRPEAQPCPLVSATARRHLCCGDSA